MNFPQTAAIYSELAAIIGRRDQSTEAASLFEKAHKLLEQVRMRSPGDERIKRVTAQTLAAHAGFLVRIGRLADSLVALDAFGRWEFLFRQVNLGGCVGR